MKKQEASARFSSAPEALLTAKEFDAGSFACIIVQSLPKYFEDGHGLWGLVRHEFEAEELPNLGRVRAVGEMAGSCDCLDSKTPEKGSKNR